ncbi:MAG: hypothetical protein KAS32_25000 [Candidatus Peribacteraceae bacterium]|nr:hypothetical protein [Candidatus Peribacteraceae bacterium]
MTEEERRKKLIEICKAAQGIKEAAEEVLKNSEVVAEQIDARRRLGVLEALQKD